MVSRNHLVRFQRRKTDFEQRNFTKTARNHTKTDWDLVSPPHIGWLKEPRPPGSRQLLRDRSFADSLAVVARVLAFGFVESHCAHRPDLNNKILRTQREITRKTDWDFGFASAHCVELKSMGCLSDVFLTNHYIRRLRTSNIAGFLKEKNRIAPLKRIVLRLARRLNRLDRLRSRLKLLDSQVVLLRVRAARRRTHRPVHRVAVIHHAHRVDFVPARDADRIQVQLDALALYRRGQRDFRRRPSACRRRSDPGPARRWLPLPSSSTTAMRESAPGLYVS